MRTIFTLLHIEVAFFTCVSGFPALDTNLKHSYASDTKVPARSCKSGAGAQKPPAVKVPNAGLSCPNMRQHVADDCSSGCPDRFGYENIVVLMDDWADVGVVVFDVRPPTAWWLVYLNRRVLQPDNKMILIIALVDNYIRHRCERVLLRWSWQLHYCEVPMPYLSAPGVFVHLNILISLVNILGSCARFVTAIFISVFEPWQVDLRNSPSFV